MVVASVFWSLIISARMCTLSLASRLDRGSSNRKTSGSRTRVRPTATRCLWPPESALGFFVPGDHPERGTLRTAGRPDQHHKLPIVDSEVDALHRLIAVCIDFSDLLQDHLCHARVPLLLHPPGEHARGDVSLEDKR